MGKKLDTSIFDDSELFAPPAVASDGEDYSFVRACAQLTRNELTLIQGVLTGLTPAVAARKAFPSKKAINAAELLRKPHIARALELGRMDLAVEVQKEMKYDVIAAMNELDQRIANAHIAGAHSAIATMMGQKQNIAGLTVNRHEIAHAGFVINVSGIDVSKMGATIEGESTTEDENTE